MFSWFKVQWTKNFWLNQLVHSNCVCVSFFCGGESGLTAPGTDTPSSRRFAGRRRWASCCSPKPSLPASGGWTRRSSGPPQTAAYQAGIPPDVTQKTETLWLAARNLLIWAPVSKNNAGFFINFRDWRWYCEQNEIQVVPSETRTQKNLYKWVMSDFLFYSFLTFTI